ncbi:helix-turn-helix domain-containing protein [Tsukamurella sp. NPDC003166]|uniref:GlxA family transcriptional regulator n=1 Tax=Tsukamurella sp. NPDC003166 TaxID=3154444 RepID=UPI0033BA18E6
MSQESSQPRSVAILVDEGSNPFEFACACEVFGTRRAAQLGFELYRTRVVAAQSAVRVRDGLFTLTGAADLSALDQADTIVVPNRPDPQTPSRADVVAALRHAHARGARLVGLCTGAFTLAEAGLLAGRPAAVHWQVAELFRELHPDVDVRPGELYVDDGDVLTSAGSAAALDLALHIVRTDHGAEIANHVSRRLVFAGFRDGGQRQFIERAVPAPRRVPLSATLDWAQERLDRPLGVADLARHANVSPATLHRRFRDELGTTPLAWLTSARVASALRLLEGTPATMEDVAHRSGLGTAANLRALVKRRTGLSPSAYRSRFRAPGVPA